MNRFDGLAQASQQLDSKLIAAGLKHTPSATAIARDIVAEGKAIVTQRQIDNAPGASASRAVAASYFGNSK